MKTKKITLAVKVDYEVTERTKTFCRERGIKYGFFVEKALVEQLAKEELKEDILDLKNLRDFELQAASIEEYSKNRRV